MKKSRKKLLKTSVLVVAGAIVFGSGVAFASSVLLNWTGGDAMIRAGIYIDQATQKLIKTSGEKDNLAQEKAELETEIEDLNKEVEDLNREINDLKDQVSNKDEGWTEKDQQIIDLNNQIINKNNEIAQKQNDIEHLTRQLEAANAAAAEINRKVENAENLLTQNDINIWN